jgi:hypothetical protein
MPRIVYGERYYGRVDRAAGLFHVATAFFHVNYVPLWPLQSCVIREDDRGFDCNGEAVGLRLKSVLVGYARGWLAGLSSLLAAFGGFLCGMAAYPLSKWVAVLLALVLGVFLGWAHGFVLTEAPPPRGAHPVTARLPWHLALSGFTMVVGGGQLLVATAVRGIVGPEFAAPLTVLPVVAIGLLAGAQLLGYGYRLTLLLTPAGYERALDLAARFGFSRRLVQKRYGRRLREREPVDY